MDTSSQWHLEQFSLSTYDEISTSSADVGARVEPLGPSRAPLLANFFRIPILRLVKEL